MNRRVLAALLMLALGGAGCGRRAPDDRSAAPGPGAASDRGDSLGADSLTTEPTVEDAAATLRAYYTAIQARRYGDAYVLWSGRGESSGQTLEAFAKGFAHTDSVAVTIGDPSPMGAAAGSRYLTFPVRILARTSDGATESFAGTYTLRRSVVDGATPEQRQWRIYSAEIRKER